MSRASIQVSARCLITLSLVPVCALADPRGIGAPPEPQTPEVLEARRVQRVADMEAWLPRLVGRFRYEGIVDLNGTPERSEASWLPDEESDESEVPELDPGNPVDPFKLKRAHGRGDCVAIGNGPGVHCVLDVVWQDKDELAGPVLRGEEPFLSPATRLYGIDAIAGVTRYLQLDKDGLTEAETGIVKGNTLTWTFYTGEALKERRITRIHARPGGNVVQMSIEVETLDPSRGWILEASIVFDGRREDQDAPIEVAGPFRAAR